MGNGNGSKPSDDVLEEIKKGHWLFKPTDRDRQAIDGAINAEVAKKWEEALKGVLRPQVRRLLYTPVILDELSEYALSDERIHYCFLAGGFAGDKMGDLDLLSRAAETLSGKEFIVRSYADVDAILVISGPHTQRERENIAKDVSIRLKLPEDVEPTIRGNLVYNIETNHVKTEEEMLKLLFGHRGVIDISSQNKLSSKDTAAIIDAAFHEDKHDRDPTRRYVLVYERTPNLERHIKDASESFKGGEVKDYKDFLRHVNESDTGDYSLHSAINGLLDCLRIKTNRSPRSLKDYENRVVLPFFQRAASHFPEELESFRQRHPNYVSKFSSFYSPAPVA